MIKKISFLFLVNIACAFMMSQVGVNTNVPQATLDIKEGRISNIISGTASDGLQIPKLSLTELVNKNIGTYTITNNVGTLVYILDGPDLIVRPSGPSSSLANNITKEGYYHFSQSGQWLPVGKLDNERDVWITTPLTSSIDLNLNSVGVARSPNTNITIKDNGFVGVNNDNPTKKLDINANNDNIRIRNLKINDQMLPTSSLVIDNAGNVTKSQVENFKGQIMRIPISDASNIDVLQTAIRLAEDSPSSVSPSGHTNFINTIIGSSIKRDTALVSASGVPARTSDIIKLPKGIYRITVRLVGDFRNVSLANSSAFIKVAAGRYGPTAATRTNAAEVSLQNYNSNTGGLSNTGFTYTDILNLNYDRNFVDFLIETTSSNNANINFDISPSRDVGSGKVMHSLIFIQRLL